MWSQKFTLFILLIISSESFQKVQESNSDGYVADLIASFFNLAPLQQQTIITEVLTIRDILSEIPAKESEDTYLNITQLINKYGYDFEAHQVVTEDGYIIALHRIPSNGPPVLLNHGILLSSDDFVTAGPESALSYYLASLGYDVWIGNARGNKYSKKHVSLRPVQAEFWDFSWHEIGIYDLPAQIDYILGITGYDSLSYVGFSQGNTALYVMGSERPEYNDKIKIAAVLSPVAWFTHIFSPVLRLLFKADVFGTLIRIGQPEFDFRLLFELLCREDAVRKLLCTNVLYLAFGYDRAQINITNIPIITGHTPTSISSKQFLHYQQLMNSGYFRQFDYGKERNLEYYGSESPPNYNLKNVKMPLVLFYSDSDFFSSIVDVETLISHLPNVKKKYLIKNFSHIDFLYGLEIKPKIYERIAKIFAKYR